MVARDYISRLVMIGVSLTSIIGIGYTTYALFIRNKTIPNTNESLFIGGDGGNFTKIINCENEKFLFLEDVRSGIYVDSMNFSCSNDKTIKGIVINYGSWLDKISFTFYNGSFLEKGGNGGVNSKTIPCEKEIRGISYRYGKFIDSVKITCN